MTPEEAVANLIELASLDREQFIKKIPEFNAARARVLSMMREDPADTAASALADVQAIREQRREPQVLQGRVADLEEEASEMATTIELCAKGLQELRDRVAALARRQPK